MTAPADIIVLGNRSGLGPALTGVLDKNLSTIYFPVLDEKLNLGLDMDEIGKWIGSGTTIIYMHLLFSLAGTIKKKIARHNIKMIEDMADLLHNQIYKEFILISHYLAPAIRDIEQASTQNHEPPDLVKGLQKVEQVVHRLIAEEHNARIVRIPFIGRRPKSISSDSTIQVTDLNSLAEGISKKVLDTSTEVIESVEGIPATLLDEVLELNSPALDLFAPSLLERMDKLFSKNDIIT